MIKKEKPRLKNYSKSDLIYICSYSFYKYFRSCKKFDKLFLVNFFNDLNKYNKPKTKKEKTKKKKLNLYYAASELYSDFTVMNTMNYQMLKERRRSPNIILIIYFLKCVIMVTGKLMKNN